MGFFYDEAQLYLQDFREKNSDQIRTDIVGNLKSSSLSFVRELMGTYLAATGENRSSGFLIRF